MPFCDKCNEHFFSDTSHRCPPRWRVWRHDEEDACDGVVLYALDAEDAAEKWAERDDSYSADYRIVGGSEAEVSVVLESDYVGGEDFGNTVTRFVVSGESVPTYHATETK